MYVLSAYKFRLYPDEEQEKTPKTSSAKSSITGLTTKG